MWSSAAATTRADPNGISRRPAGPLAPVIQNLGEWGLCYAQDPLQEGDLDVTILTWNIRRRVDANVFGSRRVTVQFEFTDVPKGKRCWWFVNDRGSVDLCPTDPGFPVDIYITTDIRTMVHVWVGKMSIESAVRSERMEIIGPRQLCAPGFCTAQSI